MDALTFKRFVFRLTPLLLHPDRRVSGTHSILGNYAIYCWIYDMNVGLGTIFPAILIRVIQSPNIH